MKDRLIEIAESIESLRLDSLFDPDLDEYSRGSGLSQYYLLSALNDLESAHIKLSLARMHLKES